MKPIRQQERRSFFKATSKELRESKASDFREGDIIQVSRYLINIKYGTYDKPSLCSTVKNCDTYKTLDCTPGAGIPYYIDDFLHR